MDKTTEIAAASSSVFKANTWSLRYLRDLVSLTKPRVMSLLLISCCCPMVLASGGEVAPALVLWVLCGGALVCGSASAVNCIWDRDIDSLMERTRARPLVTGRVSPFAAGVFAFLTGIIGLVVLAMFANPLAAAIALLGHLYYVMVYTVWLKRSTSQNIVIGGAAGAVPPLVGWAAVTGDLNLTAFLLFLLIFLWTPPHFWALALNKNDDYRRANVPMLPVVAGERATHNQMLLYSLALIPVCILLSFSSAHLGWFSFVIMLLLSTVFASKVFQLKTLFNASIETKTKKAWDVFSFSLVFLSLFFVSIVIDATVM